MIPPATSAATSTLTQMETARAQTLETTSTSTATQDMWPAPCHIPNATGRAEHRACRAPAQVRLTADVTTAGQPVICLTARPGPSTVMTGGLVMTAATSTAARPHPRRRHHRPCHRPRRPHRPHPRRRRRPRPGPRRPRRSATGPTIQGLRQHAPGIQAPATMGIRR